MDDPEGKPLLLVVDDQPKNLEILGHMLSDGYDLIAVNSAAKALKCIELERPDLILLDVMMPETGGFQLCEELKSTPEFTDIPVIFLTALAESDDVARGFQAGGVDYVTKPFSSVELLARIATHVEIKRSHERIAKVLSEKAALLHLLTHDLKNPVACVESALEFLDPMPADPGEYLDMIRSATRQALAIIDNVNSMMALERGKINLSLGDIDLRSCLSEAELLLRGKFTSKQIDLVVNCPADTWVRADHVSLVNSVIANLLTNALKFSTPGSTVLVKVEPGRPLTTLSVIDSGIGIPREILPTLFSMTKPTNRVGTAGERGTGFGLPLVKKHVDAYGGSIEVLSKDVKAFPHDHGTAVRITLTTAQTS